MESENKERVAMIRSTNMMMPMTELCRMILDA